MAIALPGLASGLDSAALIKSLMQLEAIPQGLLKRKATLSTSTVTVLQALNSRVSDLAELAKTTAKPASLDLHTATTTSESVTTTVSAGASAGSLDLVVGQLAKAQTSVSDSIAGWSEGEELTIDGPNGAVTVTAGSLDALVTAINKSEAGVKAMKVSAGVDDSGQNLYRLQFTSADTGAASAFTIEGLGTTQTAAAQDAQVTLWAGTAAEQTVSSAKNTFENLLPGVSVTVAKASTDPVTLTVARDTEAATKVAKDFVAALGDIFTFIDNRSRVTSATDSTGNTTTQGGVFQSDSTVRAARQALMSAIAMPINGHSPTDLGISVTKSGVLEFDAEKFAAALSENPDKVEAALSGLAGRVAAAADIQSDKYDGVLTAKIKGQESLSRSLSDQIAEWDLRLANRQSTLERTYASLEVRMGALNAQSSWLTSQIASLPTYGGSKK